MGECSQEYDLSRLFPSQTISTRWNCRAELLTVGTPLLPVAVVVEKDDKYEKKERGAGEQGGLKEDYNTRVRGGGEWLEEGIHTHTPHIYTHS